VERTRTKRSSTGRAWEELAQREPFYAVLTDERFRQDKMSAEVRREFFATGDADVAHLFDLIGDGFTPRSALDFGCGVGRLTLALTKRIPRVVGVDIAPTMLSLAREMVPAAEFRGDLPREQFDLVVSLIVLQHVPVAEGTKIIRDLLLMTSPAGVAVLQVTVSRPGSWLRSAARRIRARVPLVHRLATLIEGGRALPYMEMNVYPLEAISKAIRSAGCAQVAEETTNHGGIEGRILVVRKLHSV
jgi:ubiquinone/menaquinone biosynthesis C-methylase UbiE